MAAEADVAPDASCGGVCGQDVNLYRYVSQRAHLLGMRSRALADEQDRRVEPRGAIAGSGMLTDPERVASLQTEAARRQRAWRAPPQKGFAAILDEQAQGDDGETEDEAEGTAAGGSQTNEQEMEHSPTGEPAPAEHPDMASHTSTADPPALRVPPDPRIKALHRMLQHQQSGTQQGHSRRAGSKAGPKKGSR